MKLWTRIILLAALQFAALAAMVADKQWTLHSGTPVVLQTVPVDPRSLFMGDFARLAYPISQLPLDGASALGGDKDFKRHDPVWVALKAEAGGAKAVSVHHQRSAIPSGLLAIKGEVESDGDGWDSVNDKPLRQRTLQVRYGIEQYFVPEGTGGNIERPQGGKQVSVRVAIDARGKAGILAVLFDGREVYRETLF